MLNRIVWRKAPALAIMKKISFLLLIIMALIVISGCAENHAFLRAGSTSVRNDVFQELASASPVPAGHADLPSSPR